VFANFVKYAKEKRLKKLSDIATRHVEEYILTRKERDNLAPKSANVELTALRGAFQFAIDMKSLPGSGLWDGTDDSGSKLPSGLYMVRATHGGVTKSVGVRLLK